MKITIGKKIASIIVVMAALIGISGIVGTINIGKVGKNADIIMQQAKIVDSIQDTRVSFQQLLMPPNDYLITGDEEEKENFERLAKSTNDNLAKCDELLQGHKHYIKREVDDKSFLAEIEKALVAIENLSRDIFSMAAPLKQKSGNTMEEMDNTAYRVAEELDRLETLTRKLCDPELTDAINELNLSFHQLLMPTNDFLITGDKNEIEKFDELLSITKAKLIDVSNLLAKNKGLITGPDERVILENAQKDLIRIESLAREILSIRDPVRVESGRKMKDMDAAGDKATEILGQLVKIAHESGRHELASAIQRLRISFQKIVMPANDYLIHGNTEERENFEKLFALAKEDLAIVSKQINTGEEKEILDKIDKEWTIVTSLSRQILSISDPVGTESARKMEQMDMIADHVIEDLHLLLNNAKKDIERAMEVADKSEATSKIFSIASLFVLIVAGLGMGFGVSLPIIKSVHALVVGTQKIAGGDLTYHVRVKTKDELLELSNSFNQMTDEIQKRNEKLQTMNEELQSTNEELEASNEELRSTTEELEASNEELQSTTEELETANEELRQTQEQLIQKEKLAAVGQLASGVGHELRNPLGVIKNAVYYVRTRVGTEDAKLAKHLAIMEREINNSNKIISDLLGFSRTRTPAISPQDINKIVQDAIEVVEVPENVLLVKELGDELPKTLADPDQMHQAFVNIILNAIQAMAEGGQLKIATKRKNDFVEIEFSDTGCGIPQENLSKLFDPFFTTKARGIGLGLAVSHGIIERNNGTIEVKSKVGKGTTFIVKLPVEMQKYDIQATDKQKVAVG